MNRNMTEDDEEFKKGKEFNAGRYIIVKYLGAGKFGRVDLVFDIEKNTK